MYHFGGKSGKSVKMDQNFWTFLIVKSHYFTNSLLKSVLFFFLSCNQDASRRIIGAIKHHYPMIFNFHLSKGGPFWFTGGPSATPRGWFSKCFFGPYGISHTYKCQGKTNSKVWFLDTPILVWGMGHWHYTTADPPPDGTVSTKGNIDKCYLCVNCQAVAVFSE